MRYNRPNTPMDNMRDFVTRGGMPATLALLGVNMLTFLAMFFSPDVAGSFIINEMMLSSKSLLHAPWTILTFPLVAGPFSFWLIFNWVFFWLSGGSLERSWGSRRFTIFFFAVTAISGLSLFCGSLLLRTPIPPLFDLFLPLTGLVVAFCMLNPEETIVLYFFPVRAKYVALIVTLWTYFTYGQMQGPWLGLFALGGILAAFLYVRYGRPWADIDSYARRPRPAPRGPDLRVYPAASRFTTKTKPQILDGSAQRSPFDLRGRWKDYQERRRLEKLWKDSGFSEPDQRWKDDDRRR
jgi:membrane associated rhomboid family serine protease